MKRTSILILFICALFTPVIFAGNAKVGLRPAAKTHSSHPFKKAGRWFKHLFRKKKRKTAAAVTNIPVDVNSVTLKLVETPTYYEKNQTYTLIGPGYIEVATYAEDPENDTLVYKYAISGGRLVGYDSGPKIFWDLSGAPAGAYFITAGADDGCGVCGRTVTRQVIVPESGNAFLCPSARVTSDKYAVASGDMIAFHVIYEQPEDAGRSPMWSLLSGEIVSGQGTDTLFVMATQAGEIKPSFYFDDESAGCWYSMYQAVKVIDP